jgi:hypothetical protein
MGSRSFTRPRTVLELVDALPDDIAVGLCVWASRTEHGSSTRLSGSLVATNAGLAVPATGSGPATVTSTVGSLVLGVH